VLLQGGGLASPNLFAYTLANCFLGDAAILFGLTGSLVAINEEQPENLGALRMALEELALGEAGTMLAGVCDLPVPGALAGSSALQPGALFLVLSLTPPLEPVGYGTVSLDADGAIRHNGAVVGSLIELVDNALAGGKK
jgi:3-oxoacyl-[acyl-carrier-protein] synthase II